MPHDVQQRLRLQPQYASNYVNKVSNDDPLSE